MLTCDPCSLHGGKAQAARYSVPDDRSDLWDAHQAEHARETERLRAIAAAEAERRKLADQAASSPLP